MLLGSKVTKVNQNSKTDISIFFDNGFQVDTVLQGDRHTPFKIINHLRETNEFKVIELTIHGSWKTPDELEFTDVEKLSSKHSENTVKRWKDIVPAKSFNNHCRNCTYYLSTSGRFYFWDFGICSNGKSVYDGKVVGVKSSCENYSFNLNDE